MSWLCKRKRRTRWQVYTFCTLIIIVITARLLNELKISRTPEGEFYSNQSFFVFIWDYESSCQKVKKKNFQFTWKNCSSFPTKTLARVTGRVKVEVDKILKTNNDLIDSDISVVEPKWYSVEHQQAIIFAYFRSWQLKLYKKTQQNLLKYINSEVAELTTLMLWGKNEEPKITKISEKMKRAGLSHVLAVSGFHLNFVSDIIVLFITAFSCLIRYPQKCLFGIWQRMNSVGEGGGWKKFWRRKFWKQVSVFIFLAFLMISLFIYSLVVGAGASVLRAYWMLILRFTDRYLFKIKLNFILVLFVILVFMLLIRPFCLFDVGWQLSFAACGGLAIQNWLPWTKFLKKTKIGGSLASVIAVQTMTWPIIYWYWREFNYGTLISNIILMPVIEISFLGNLWLLLSYGFNLDAKIWLRGVYSLAVSIMAKLAEILTKLLDIFQFEVWSTNTLQNRTFVSLMVFYYLFLFYFIVRRCHVRQQNL